MFARKDYRKLADTALDKMKREVETLLGTLACLNLPAVTVHALVMEAIDSREEIFRYQLCETVDQILNEELEDEEDLLAFRWPEDYCLGTSTRIFDTIYKPAFPCAETIEMPVQGELFPSDPAQVGRRLPRFE